MITGVLLNNLFYLDGLVSYNKAMYVTHFSKTTQIDIKQAADPNIKADPI
jgi:hypothetical protein